MDKFFIIESGGKQYKVAAGEKLRVEKLDAAPGGTVIFDKVLLAADGDAVQVGTPYLKGVSVQATVERDGRAKKLIVFRYHSKTRYRKKKGHRQEFTEVRIAT